MKVIKLLKFLPLVLGAMLNAQSQYLGKVGINTETPTNTLHIKSTADPIRLEGLQNGSSTDTFVVVNEDGVLKKNMVAYPTAAIIRMSQKMSNFLSTSGVGGTQKLENLVLESNNINGLTFNASTSTVTFPKGTYLISFSYEGEHNASGCTISSYFIDFPTPSGISRIHSTAAHNQGGNSNHGGTVTYASVLTGATKNWHINLGRGVSGNCTGAGMSLVGGSTFISILRVSD